MFETFVYIDEHVHYMLYDNKNYILFWNISILF